MARFGREKRKRRLLVGIHTIPTIVTLGNLLCGFASIALSMRASHPPPFFDLRPLDPAASSNDCLHAAGLLIFCAMIFDVLDGKIARWTKSTSKFGLEMDSLCDVVSFGVAPAVLVKAMIDQELPTYPILDRYIWPMLATYVCCAALRLARYNVEADTGHRDFFFGMPSPGAAGCAASLALLIQPAEHHLPIQQLNDQMSQVKDWQWSLHHPVLLALPFIMLGLGILMVSRVHYPHLGDKLLRGRKSLMHVMVVLLGLALIAAHHEIMLALAFNGYMLCGLVNEMRIQIFHRATLDAEAQQSSQPQPPEVPKEKPLG